MNKLKRLTSQGDTIIEVMVVLAVLGLALSISYATASRSLTQARQAQENTEATTLAQTQIEQLRGNYQVTIDSSNYIYANPYFCLNNGVRTNLIGTDVKDYASYPPACKFHDDRYHVAIKYDSPSTFTVTVVWDDLSGNDQSRVTLSYRLPKP